jgi:hypothetical protein
MVTAPATGETLLLIRSQALAQTLDLVDGDDFPSDLVERRFDILQGQIQNLQEQLNRALKMPVQSTLSGLELPEPSAAQDGYSLVWDDATDAFIFAAELSTTATISAFGATLIDDANAAAALTTLGVSAFAQTVLDDASASAARTTLGAIASTDVVQSIIVACSDETTAITTGTAKVTFRMPYAFTLTAVRASVGTAPTGSTIIIDINESGSTILSTKLSIDASEKTSTTAASAAVISDTSLADDAEITIDFDQVGSTIAGAGVKVALIGYRTV